MKQIDYANTAKWVAVWVANAIAWFALGCVVSLVTIYNHGGAISEELANLAVRVKGFDPDPTMVTIELKAESLTAVNWDELEQRKLTSSKKEKK